MKKFFLVIPLIILMAGGIVLLKKRKQAIVDAPVAQPVTYTIRTVRPQTREIARKTTFLARLESTDSAEISSKLSGRIREVLVHESDRVHRGDLLVRIDDQEIVSSRRSLQAQLASAKKQLQYNLTLEKRDQALYKAGGLALEKLQASEVALAKAGAIVRDLQEKIKGQDNQLEYLNLTAPFDGIVGTIALRKGDLASPGRPVLTLNSLPQKLTFSFMAGEDEVLVGQEVLLDGRKTGMVNRLYNDARNGLTVAEVKLEHHIDLPSGSYLTITVISRRASGCSVPLQALLHRAGTTSIMLYQVDHFEEQPVTVTVQGRAYALVEPCVDRPVAVASEAKLSMLPTYGHIRVSAGESNE